MSTSVTSSKTQAEETAASASFYQTGTTSLKYGNLFL